jgi:hypothetical protein
VGLGFIADVRGGGVDCFAGPSEVELPWANPMGQAGGRSGPSGFYLRVPGAHFGHNFAHILHARWRVGQFSKF